MIHFIRITYRQRRAAALATVSLTLKTPQRKNFRRNPSIIVMINSTEGAANFERVYKCATKPPPRKCSKPHGNLLSP